MPANIVTTIMPSFRNLEIGDPDPWFSQASTNNPKYHFHTAAGRYLVLCFFGTSANKKSRRMLNIIDDYRDLFDDNRIAFFGITLDPLDAKENRVTEILPGIRFFWDFDGKISRLYGALPLETQKGKIAFRPLWIILNPNLQIRAIFPTQDNEEDFHIVGKYLQSLPDLNSYCGLQIPAPVLILPNVFEPEFCQYLISLYDSHGGEDSGFMRDVNEKTTKVIDYDHKRQADYVIEDTELINRIQKKILKRVNPEIKKVYQFEATRMERYTVGCYSAANSGHFRPHRDNTTKGTAHRKFAMSVLLNDDYEGGQLGFPEYGSQFFKAPFGTAIIFSCSLLHTVTPVTRGHRYVFIPFLYDDEAAKIREENNPFLGENLTPYRKMD